jgi:aminoglycoside phosphotransferase (APT) family kinase protein
MSPTRNLVALQAPARGGGNGAPAWRPVEEADLVAWLRRDGARRVGGDASQQLERVSITIVRHAAGKRLTARCRLVLVAPNGGRELLTVFAKQYRRRDLARRLARQLRTLRFAPGDPPVRFPKLLGLDARRGIVFMEALHGRPFAPELDGVPARSLEPAGALMAAFHRASAAVEKRVTRADELVRTRECADAIAQVYPDLVPALERLQSSLAHTAWGRSGRRALLHGSFRPNHLMVHGSELAVFDLESLRVGPPGYDLANCVATLHYQQALGRLSAPGRRRAVRALLRGYRAHGGDESCARALWLTAALLVQKQALKVATRSRAQASSRARTRALVARAEQLAARAAATPAGPGIERLERELA